MFHRPCRWRAAVWRNVTLPADADIREENYRADAYRLRRPEEFYDLARYATPLCRLF